MVEAGDRASLQRIIGPIDSSLQSESDAGLMLLPGRAGGMTATCGGGAAAAEGRTRTRRHRSCSGETHPVLVGQALGSEAQGLHDVLLVFAKWSVPGLPSRLPTPRHVGASDGAMLGRFVRTNPRIAMAQRRDAHGSAWLDGWVPA